MVRLFLYCILTFVWPHIPTNYFSFLPLFLLYFIFLWWSHLTKSTVPAWGESWLYFSFTRLWMVSEHNTEAIFEMWSHLVLLWVSSTVGSHCVSDTKRLLRALTSLKNWCDLVCVVWEQGQSQRWLAHCHPEPLGTTMEMPIENWRLFLETFDAIDVREGGEESILVEVTLHRNLRATNSINSPVRYLSSRK